MVINEKKYLLDQIDLNKKVLKSIDIKAEYNFNNYTEDDISIIEKTEKQIKHYQSRIYRLDAKQFNHNDILVVIEFLKDRYGEVHKMNNKYCIYNCGHSLSFYDMGNGLVKEFYVRNVMDEDSGKTFITLSGALHDFSKSD